MGLHQKIIAYTPRIITLRPAYSFLERAMIFNGQWFIQGAVGKCVLILTDDPEKAYLGIALAGLGIIFSHVFLPPQHKPYLSPGSYKILEQRSLYPVCAEEVGKMGQILISGSILGVYLVSAMVFRTLPRSEIFSSDDAQALFLTNGLSLVAMGVHTVATKRLFGEKFPHRPPNEVDDLPLGSDHRILLLFEVPSIYAQLMGNMTAVGLPPSFLSTGITLARFFSLDLSTAFAIGAFASCLSPFPYCLYARLEADQKIVSKKASNILAKRGIKFKKPDSVVTPETLRIVLSAVSTGTTMAIIVSDIAATLEDPKLSLELLDTLTHDLLRLFLWLMVMAVLVTLGHAYLRHRR